MEILSLVQDGERLYRRGDLKEAIKKFKRALCRAQKCKESEYNINVCRFNLAAVYAANQETEETNENLRQLNIGFLDIHIENGRAYESYLKAIAARNKRDLEKALVLKNDCGRRRYILEILVQMDEISRTDQIRYLKKLGKVYAIQQEHLKRIKVMCKRAQLLYLEKNEVDSLYVLHNLETEFQEHYGGPDEEIQTTTSKCKTLAGQHEDTDQLNEIVPIWNDVGLLYSQLKKYDEAITCFEKGIALVRGRESFNDFCATLYQNIGAAWTLKSKSEDEYRTALDKTEKAIETNGNQDRRNEAKRAKCFLNKGHIFWKLKERSYAIIAFTHALVDDGCKLQAYEAIGDIASEMNEHQSAQDHLKKALEIAEKQRDRDRIIEKLVNVCSQSGRIQTAYKRDTLVTGETMSSVMRNTKVPQRKTGKAISSVKKKVSYDCDFDSTSSGCECSSDDHSCSGSSSSACCTDCESDSTYSSCYKKRLVRKTDAMKKKKDDKKPTGKLTDGTLQNVRKHMKLIVSDTPRKSEDEEDETGDDDDGSSDDDDDEIQEEKHNEDAEKDDDNEDAEKDDDNKDAEKDDDNEDAEKDDDNEDAEKDDDYEDAETDDDSEDAEKDDGDDGDDNDAGDDGDDGYKIKREKTYDGSDEDQDSEESDNDMEEGEKYVDDDGDGGKKNDDEKHKQKEKGGSESKVIERDEELRLIRAKSQLKVTLNQLECIIKAASVYTARNEGVLQELTEVTRHESVSNSLSSDEFTNKLQQVLSTSRLNGNQYGTDDLVTVRQETSRLQLDTDFTNHLEVLLQKSPLLEQTPKAGDEVPKAEIQGAEPQSSNWLVTMNKIEEERKVSQLDDDFKKKLIGVLLHPPDRSTQHKWAEPELQSGNELGQCYINIGLAEIKRSNLDKAYMAYSEALNIGNDEAIKELQWKAHDGLGTVAASRNDFETAIKNYMTAINLLDMEYSTVEVTSLRNYIAEKLEKMERKELHVP